MNPGELDSLLERASDLTPLEKLEHAGDLLELQRWAMTAESLIVELRKALREGVSQHGGILALQLRKLLEARIIKEVNGRAVLTNEVHEHSLAVHLMPDEVIIDVRLRVGKAKEDGTAQLGGGTERHSRR